VQTRVDLPAGNTATNLRAAGGSNPGGAVSHPNYDEWTIDHWRVEPRLNLSEIYDPPEAEVTPAFWKDLTTAALVVAALWTAAAIVFG
jgi:hypothetical protein